MEAQVRELASKYLKNVRDGGADNLRAACPFHATSAYDRSLALNLRTGAWLCFNAKCGAKGNIPQLLKRLGMPSVQVDRIIQGLCIPPPLDAQARKRREITSGTWSTLPEYILASYEGDVPQMQDLGFDPELLDDFDIGYDRRARRITFPIRDFMGRLAAISGRACDKDQIPRYKVYDARPPSGSSPGGELYGIVDNYVPDNRKHLYGFHDVYPERFFRREEGCPPLVISEGYKSTLWLRQSGFPHAVGLQGSSMTPSQQRLLARLQGPYVVLLDNEPGKAFPDEKGLCAAVRIAEQLRASGRALICQYPSHKNQGTAPDDCTDEELDHMVKTAKSVTQLLTMEQQ